MRVLVRARHIIEQLQAYRDTRRKGAFGAFYRAGGNAILAAGLPVTSSDVVLDAGAYRGEWADQILIRYGSRMVLFEPVPSYAAALKQHYGNNDRVEVIAAALAGHAGHMMMSIAGEGSSLLRRGQSGPSFEAPLLDVAAVLDDRSADGAACLKLNIEGAEYDVLDRLIANDLVSNFRSLIIQFHDFVPEAIARRGKIRTSLSATHRCVFDYPFVWERWDRK